MKHITVLLAALVLILGTHAVTRADPPAAAPAAPAGVQKWEYRVVPSSESTGLDAVNAAAREGWRLAVLPDGWRGETPSTILRSVARI